MPHAKEVFKIGVKLFTTDERPAHLPFVEVFHHWIQRQAIPDHLLIDVADYAHAAEGPGTVLVSREANFYTDRRENRLGLLYLRKLASPGDFRQRLRYAVIETAKAAAMLEQDPLLDGKLKFRTDEIEIRLNDRLLAPPSEQTLGELRPDLDAIGQEALGGTMITIEPHLAPQELFEVRLKLQQSGDVAGLLKRMGAEVPAPPPPAPAPTPAI